MTSRQWAVRACRAAARLMLCAVTAMVVSLNGINPAAAATEDFRVTYERGISHQSGNSYSVTITGTVTRVGGHYELKGTVDSTCIHSTGPDQKWSLAFGSSAEGWRYVEGSCGDGTSEIDGVDETGPLLRDGRVYLQAGAYGGTGNWGASWGWGTQRSVWV
ncbi:hypothetical protein SAMN05216268_11795 [Streptomyces yunnanensis]|uniref:Secreted protein n=1 Tax=Streptomyces yunnanensis TaxID=156453 RepID=A0A9X8N4W5_9ACTN|nr:hypothetical protein SAMN05216268_11795 [Streptomyces yunnanensis]